jgi:hypothetical protein
MSVSVDIPVEDMLAIQATFNAYSAGLDRKDYHLFRQVWTEDCSMTWSSPGEARDASEFVGRDFLVSEMERIHRRLDGSLHRVTNTRYLQYDGTQATCRTYVDAMLIRRDAPGGDMFQAIGFYDDVLRREEGGWRIASRDFTFLHAIGNPFVPDVEPGAGEGY